MTLLAAVPIPPAAGQIALAVLLAAAGVLLLLPKPKLRSVAGGTAALVAALVVSAAYLHQTFGEPMPDLIGTALFCLFSAGAVGFGAAVVVQRNPARGAIAFAFVVLSTCGLFLLLAAPFLMAATVIVYAGAIVVTFLFVLMLSQAAGPSDENDRTREPLLGSLAGFAFTGLVLFTLYQTRESTAAPSASAFAPTRVPSPLPAPVVTAEERKTLSDAAEKLTALDDDAFYGDPTAAGTTWQKRAEFLTGIEWAVEDVVGVSARKDEGTIREGSLPGRLTGYRTDPQAKAVLDRAAAVRETTRTTLRKVETELGPPAGRDVAGARADARRLRDEVRLLAGAGELPARNVGNLGLLLYADHLLAVELAGTLLLVATVGAVAIAHRKGVSA